MSTTHTLSLGPLSLLATQTGHLLNVTIHTPSDCAPVGKMTLTAPEWTSLVALVDCMVAAEKRHAEDNAEIERLTALTMNPGATLHGSTITEIAKERAEYHEMLRAILAACDDSTRASIGRDAPLRAVRKVIADRDSLRQQCQRMRALLSLIRDDFDIAVSAHDPSDPRHPSHGGQHTNGLCCSFGNVAPGAVRHMRRMRDDIDAAIGKDGGNE